MSRWKLTGCGGASPHPGEEANGSESTPCPCLRASDLAHAAPATENATPISKENAMLTSKETEGGPARSAEETEAVAEEGS